MAASNLQVDNPLQTSGLFSMGESTWRLSIRSTQKGGRRKYTICGRKASTARFTDQPSRHACCLVFPEAMSSGLHFPEPRRGSLTPGSHKVAPQPSGPPSVTSRPRSGKVTPSELWVPPASSLAHSISRSSKRGRIIGLRLVAISTVLCAQKSSSRRAISENFTISSHRVSPSTPPARFHRTSARPAAGAFAIAWCTQGHVVVR